MAAIHSIDDRARGRLEAYAALLRRWQPVKNLVAPSTLPDLWRRHMADAAQAFAAAPDARRWLDLGSGAGFPGLVTAILLGDEADAMVTLVEANGRKAAFLSTVARELRLPIRVLNERIESVAERPAEDLGRIDAVSARALADLGRLFELAEPWLTGGSRGVFHKGQDFASECDAATQSWVFDLVEHQSRIDGDGRILVVSGLKRRLPEPDPARSMRPGAR
ncbi:MAG TPA: 16S rRNA (guanine(527)-N(7))-methyltransferase RsmG [Methylomirabilota bacterium]|nr:16S rRNA (guanine(527)-N(7))-methyltransferase RsmG [Methylomirabilota bacterium]